jgi:para-aminobenzoate synthetase/4-amino-4-deoxychorismate lyase
VHSILTTETPFVLLDDGRPSGAAARLFRAPREIIEVRSHHEIPAALDQLETTVAAGGYAAGFLGYEAGLAFEPRLAAMQSPPDSDDPPLLWFGLFDTMDRIAAADVPDILPGADGAWAGAPIPGVTRQGYQAGFEAVQRYIRDGDVYQANLTFSCTVPVAGHPLALFAQLRQSSKAGYGGIVWTGSHWLLSLSPELFFSAAQGKLTARPMKGTATRLADAGADAAAALALSVDPKQRAENLMIVDLLRNDLSRIATDGSVDVPSLFHVETYPTVHQMTSTVTASLDLEKSAFDVVRAIYPCGSITGTPKIRAMEIIDQLESAKRGAYTGSIGWFDSEGDAALNVAIRTLVLARDSGTATLGLGSGIVADSQAEEEWLECLAKGAFVSQNQEQFDLIETMRFDPLEGIELLERHLARLRASARVFGFPFDRHAARNALQAATFRLKQISRLRLHLSAAGHLAIEIRTAPEMPDEPVIVAIGKRAADRSDYRLRHKTTARTVYEDARAGQAGFEVILEDEEGFVTEGCFTNIFVERDGMLLTPPLSRGLLPGVLRGELIESGQAQEAELTRADLGGECLIGNALRGLIPARLE